MVFANGSRYPSPGAICDRFGKQLYRKRPGPPLVIAAVIAALGCSAGSGESPGGGGQPGTGSGGAGAGTGGIGGNGQAGASSPSGGTTGFGGQGGDSAGTAGALSGSGGSAATGGTGAGGTTSSAGAAGTGTARGGAGGSSGGTGGASPPRDPFNVVTAGAAVDIYVDAADFPAVVRAVGDLRADVQRVSGTAPVIKNSTTGLSSTAIMVGTLGKSPAIDALAAAGKLDTMGVAGKWESAVIQAVANPVAGVTRALVIAGSDRRGTVYGIYELSQRIGVSPWYWWADVTPTPSTTITVDGARVQAGRADGQVPRHLHQRRRKLHHLGGNQAGRREETGPGDLQEGLRAALAPEGELSLAGDAPGVRRIQQVRGERRQRRARTAS